MCTDFVPVYARVVSICSVPVPAGRMSTVHIAGAAPAVLLSKSSQAIAPVHAPVVVTASAESRGLSPPSPVPPVPPPAARSVASTGGTDAPPLPPVFDIPASVVALAPPAPPLPFVGAVAGFVLHAASARIAQVNFMQRSTAETRNGASGSALLGTVALSRPPADGRSIVSQRAQAGGQALHVIQMQEKCGAGVPIGAKLLGAQVVAGAGDEQRSQIRAAERRTGRAPGRDLDDAIDVAVGAVTGQPAAVPLGVPEAPGGVHRAAVGDTGL